MTDAERQYLYAGIKLLDAKQYKAAKQVLEYIHDGMVTDDTDKEEGDEDDDNKRFYGNLLFRV